MAMDAERRQAELIAQFSAQAAALSSAPQLAALVLEATSHPALFAFSELLTLPALSKVRALPLACALLRAAHWHAVRVVTGLAPALRLRYPE
ncbi:COP9 signalosome complex subunit 7 [Zea mays]|uniref:COP9 signalosome complex subunit 7 n=1 Tax=Zea mays TaxID=4577 RepID=A0A1D6EVY5_MAIZE|nr:COP9 signalosome complex subunit 7 [Zea mays]